MTEIVRNDVFYNRGSSMGRQWGMTGQGTLIGEYIYIGVRLRKQRMDKMKKKIGKRKWQ